jgi:hypothetical protein
LALVEGNGSGIESIRRGPRVGRNVIGELTVALAEAGLITCFEVLVLYRNCKVILAHAWNMLYMEEYEG